jgi:hypothetical protein
VPSEAEDRPEIAITQLVMMDTLLGEPCRSVYDGALGGTRWRRARRPPLLDEAYFMRALSNRHQGFPQFLKGMS